MALQHPDTFQAIADRTRRDMLLLLSKDKLSINSLAANFDISRPAVSKHVKVLSEAGLIMITDQGRERYCELNPRGFEELREWLDYYDRFWKEKLSNLEILLHKKSKHKLR
jgi:DNA-binding transcriptional ArsR family regulator